MTVLTKHGFQIAGGIVVVAAVVSSARLSARQPGQSSPEQHPSPPTTCLGIVLPNVEGVQGNSMDVASGVQQLFGSFLNGPSTHLVMLEARLQSQAIEEARQKQCDRILLTKVTKKHGGGGGAFGKVLGEAASTAAWYTPYGSTVGSAVARGAAIAGGQAIASIASSTKAKDEFQLEYQVVGGDGKVHVGPKTDKAKAQVDGEDLLTPMVRKASEVIVADVGKK